MLLKMKHMVSLTASQPFTHDKYMCTQNEGLENLDHFTWYEACN